MEMKIGKMIVKKIKMNGDKKIKVNKRVGLTQISQKKELKKDFIENLNLE